MLFWEPMNGYSGKFDYSVENGALLTQDACNVSFDAETCVITPSSGLPLAFDLGDVDSIVPAEWDMQLKLYTGRRVHLRQFGKLFTRMSGELIAAWRDRTVQCLLLEDMEQVGRFDGLAGLGSTSTPAEIRLFKTNIAILPSAGTPFQWRLADLDSVTFDGDTYSVILARCGERVVLSKLAKRTDEFVSKLRAAIGALREQSARVLLDMFPFLGPDRLQRLLIAMPEGRTARLTALSAIHPKLADALLARAVDAHLKPYFEALRSRAVADSLMAGYKFIRRDQNEADADADTPVVETEDTPVVETEEDGNQAPLFFWFFLPIARAGGSPNVVAWEAGTGSGRATYFFRAGSPAQAAAGVESAVTRLTRGLALVNFRREPVYLSDESLEQQPRFRRYAIGKRKLPDLQALRDAMLGRAIHSSVEKWTAQVDSILRQAG